MTTHKLTNGCTDPRLPEWEERAFAHEVVCSAVQIAGLDGRLRQLVDGLADFGVEADVLATLGRSQFCLIEFDSMVCSETRIAMLATEGDLIVIGRETGDGLELDGLMTHDSFWAYLGSYPNIYKHLKVGNGQHEYWHTAK